MSRLYVERMPKLFDHCCNISHRKKSVQSQGILRQLVPNLVGRILGPVGCQEQNREAWKLSWAEP
jgi:hypothetical protein